MKNDTPHFFLSPTELDNRSSESHALAKLTAARQDTGSPSEDEVMAEMKRRVAKGGDAAV